VRSTLNVASTAVGLERGIIVEGSSSYEPASYNTVCFLQTFYGRDVLQAGGIRNHVLHCYSFTQGKLSFFAQHMQHITKC
jgi:hypothetical protein